MSKLAIAQYINHIALVLDASGSMAGNREAVVKVTDAQIQYLAQRSKELDQETRVTIYQFDDNVECLVYDKDVLRLPSIRGLYGKGGMTALVDATLQSIVDLKQTPELYGEHSFLIYVLTDGLENRSKNKGDKLAAVLNALPEHWTLGVFVPNANGIHEAKKFGFPANNISVWDTNAKNAVEGVGEIIKRTTEAYMQNRTLGVRGSKNLFELKTENLGKTVTKLTALNFGQYRLYDVKDLDPVTGKPRWISEFVEAKTKRAYRSGEAYYQLSKTEKVQPQKQIAVLNKKSGTLYTGANARTLLGLPDYEVKVGPTFNPEFEIFVQSTSVNRHLIPGTRLLVLS